MKLIIAIGIGVVGFGCGDKKPDIAPFSGKTTLYKDEVNTVGRSDDLVALVKKYYRALEWDGWPREEWISMYRKARSVAARTDHIAGNKFLEAVGFTFTTLHNGLHQMATSSLPIDSRQLIYFPSSWIKLLSAARSLQAASENVKERDKLLSLAADQSDRVSSRYHAQQNQFYGTMFDSLFKQCMILWNHDRCLDDAHLQLTGRTVLKAIFYAFMTEDQKGFFRVQLNMFDSVRPLPPSFYDTLLSLMKSAFIPMRPTEDMNRFIEETILGPLRIPRRTFTPKS